MKKNTLIITAITASLALTAWGLNSANSTNQLEPTPCKTNFLADNDFKKDTSTYSDFFYSVGPRFHPLTKSDFNNAKSITDFIDVKAADYVKTYKSVSVILIENDEHSDIRESGTSEMLTEKQKELLNSLDYSASFLIRADFEIKPEDIGKWEHDYFSPYYTIVPEKQAEYVTEAIYGNFDNKVSGREALVQFLAYGNKENIRNLDEDKLQPAKLYFTVTTIGTVENIHLDRSSGYPEIDKHMIQLISQTPGHWVPAENEIGEKVDQELVVSFGMVGC